MTNHTYVSTLLGAAEALRQTINNQNQVIFIEAVLKEFFEHSILSRKQIEDIAFEIFGSKSPVAKTLDRWITQFANIYEAEIDTIWNEINDENLKHRPRIERHTPSKGGAGNQTTYQITDSWPDIPTSSEGSSCRDLPSLRRVSLTHMPLLTRLGLMLSRYSRQRIISIALAGLTLPWILLPAVIIIFPGASTTHIASTIFAVVCFSVAWKLKRLIINKRLVDIPLLSTRPVLYEIAFEKNEQLTNYDHAPHYFRASVIEGDCPICKKEYKIRDSLHIQSSGIWSERIIGRCRVAPDKHIYEL